MDSINLSTIKPYSNQPITEFPKYVYKNCNQVTCYNFPDRLFPLLKAKAKVITKEKINKLCQGNKEKATKEREKFDWIYGLDKLATNFLSKQDFSENAFTVENIIQINSCFSRMDNDRPGKYRQAGIFWPKLEGLTEVGKPISTLVSESAPLVMRYLLKIKNESFLSDISDPNVTLNPIPIGISDILTERNSCLKERSINYPPQQARATQTTRARQTTHTGLFYGHKTPIPL